jgi:hypothetical protein
VIAAYAPHSGLGHLEMQQFRDQLHAASSDVAPRHFLVVLGDFNARVGSACSSSAADSYGGAFGRHGVGERNTEGRKLLDLCAATKLSVANTFFQHRPAHKLSSCSSPNQEHLLDFVLVQRKFLNIVCDVRILRGANSCGEYTRSDHHLVCATICLRLKAHRPRAPRPDVTALQDPDTAARFAAAAAAKLPSLQQLQQQPAAAIWDAVATAVTSAASQVLPELGHSSGHRLVQPSAAPLHALLRQRRALVAQLRHRCLTRSTAPIQAELRSVTQDIRREMRLLKRAATAELGEALEDAAVKGQQKEVWRLLDELCGPAPKRVRQQDTGRTRHRHMAGSGAPS